MDRIDPVSSETGLPQHRFLSVVSVSIVQPLGTSLRALSWSHTVYSAVKRSTHSAFSANTYHPPAATRCNATPNMACIAVTYYFRHLYRNNFDGH